MPHAHDTILKTNAVAFVKEALTLSKDLQSCVNIDALFCLNNMMNVKEIALLPEFLNVDTLNNALVIYFAFKEQVDLDECIITFLYTISKYEAYHQYMKDKFKVLFLLVDRHVEGHVAPSGGDVHSNAESCRQKIFCALHNLTENDEICKQINYKKFISVNIRMFQ